MFALNSQLRQAAISIPSNIAEGQGRQTTRDFLRFLSIARGSLQEVETQILIAYRLGYVKEPDQAELTERIAEVGRLVSGLFRSLSRRDSDNDY